LIEYAFEQSQHPYSRRYRTVYLSNTYGDVQVIQDWSWAQISADINTKTIAIASGASLPRINVYSEDKEAEDFFACLMSRQSIKKFTISMSGITLGCSQYVTLIKSKVPEFSEKSIVCLDSDAAKQVEGKSFNTVVLLPGALPPDQLIFEYLYNLPANHEFWKNEMQFTRDFFTNTARDVINEFAINGNTADVKGLIAAYQGEKKPRDIFKRFYKSEDFQKLVSSGTKLYNPWKHWVESNPAASNEFLEKFKAAIHSVMKNGYAVDVSKLTALKVKFKKV